MKTVFKLLIITMLFPFTMVFGQLDSNVKAKLYFQEAQKYFNQNEFDDTITYLKKAEEVLGMTNSRILNLQIKALYNSGKFKDAQAAMNLYVESYVDSSSDDLKEETFGYFVRIEDAVEAQVIEQDRIALAKAEKEKMLEDAIQEFEWHTCPTCDGEREVSEERRRCSICNVRGSTLASCDVCHGKGYWIKMKNCPDCFNGRHSYGKVLTYVGNKLTSSEAKELLKERRIDIIRATN